MARVTVIGQSGAGKSYYAGYLLEQAVPQFDLAVHYDPEDEERGLSEKGNALYGTLPVDPDAARRVNWPVLVANHKKVRVVPMDMTMGQQRALYAALCRSVMYLCQDVIPEYSGFVSGDEAHNYLRQNQFHPWSERMITGGRKHQVECLHICQRPQLLHTTVISQADRRVYFRINDNNDLAKIESVSNFPADMLENLADRECIVENKSSGDWEQISTDGCGRSRPHFAKDDGIVDEALPV